MAAKRRSSPPTPAVFPVQPGEPYGGPEGPGDTTGKFLVLFREGATKAATKALASVSGLEQVASFSDFSEETIGEVSEAPVIVFERLGVGVVEGDPQQMGAAMAAASDEDGPILAVEPERIMYALPDGGQPSFPLGPDLPSGTGGGTLPLEYLRGYRDAVVALYEQLAAGAQGVPTEEGGVAAIFADDGNSTWGLKATRADGSSFDGRGIRIAVLDTGMDLNHPDFLGRLSTDRTQSFIRGESAQDGHGHGTHCIGTAAGPLRPGIGPRYGVAHRAEIFVGKVLSDGGSGPDRSILAGIEWAIANGCQVISMSLGSPVERGEGFSRIYENVARRALEAGSLIIAAAGNDSDRPGHIAPVSRPANCPSILAVGAVDRRLRIASFSNRGLNPNGGGVDLVGPGVDVHSSAPMPRRTRVLSGTSMATPHIAGLAALFAQARGLSGVALAQALLSTARRLPLSSQDVGSGLGQAPA